MEAIAVKESKPKYKWIKALSGWHLTMIKGKIKAYRVEGNLIRVKF